MQQVDFKPWVVDDSKWGVVIEGTKYAGSVVQIKKLELADEATGQLELEFLVANRPDGLTEESYQEEEFNQVMQSIVTKLIEKAIAEHENRNNNPPDPSE